LICAGNLAAFQDGLLGLAKQLIQTKKAGKQDSDHRNGDEQSIAIGLEHDHLNAFFPVLKPADGQGWIAAFIIPWVAVLSKPDIPVLFPNSYPMIIRPQSKILHTTGRSSYLPLR